MVLAKEYSKVQVLTIFCSGIYNFCEILDLASTSEVANIQKLQHSISPDDGCSLHFTSVKILFYCDLKIFVPQIFSGKYRKTKSGCSHPLQNGKQWIHGWKKTRFFAQLPQDLPSGTIFSCFWYCPWYYGIVESRQYYSFTYRRLSTR